MIPAIKEDFIKEPAVEAGVMIKLQMDLVNRKIFNLFFLLIFSKKNFLSNHTNLINHLCISSMFIYSFGQVLI